MGSRGYTLLEVLVVVIILAVLSGFAVLKLRGQSEAQQLNEAADRFAALVEMQCEEALLGNRTIRVNVDQAGYRFEVSTRSGWQPHPMEVFRDREWPGPVSLQLDVDGAGGDRAIYCLPTGELTPFELGLRSGDGSRAGVRGTALGALDRVGREG